MLHRLAAASSSPNPLVPNWTEVIVGGIAFFIVFFALWKVLMPTIMTTLAERTDAIEGGIQRAEDAQAKANRALEQYQAQLQEARHEAARLREEAKEQGAQIIAEMREQAQAAAEANRLREQFQAQLAEARHEAARQREQALEEGVQIVAAKREEAQAEAARIIAAAHTQIDADRQQAFASLRGEIGTLAVQLAGKIVGESLDDEARQSRVVDRFLADLDASRAESSGARASS